MEQVKSNILQASAKNTELLRIISETDHALPALNQQRRLISDLEAELAASNKRMHAADAKRKKEFKDHEKYRDSVMRRFAYKATGKKEKFEGRAKKEEEEYFSALQEEQRETDTNRNITEQLNQAKSAARDLEGKAALHNDKQQELDNLYNSIFAGTTPGFPAEDEKEQAASRAIAAYRDTKNAAEAEAHAVRLLQEGQNKMRSSLYAMEEALSYSRRDMFGGGTLTDMMERNALHQAEMEVNAARMLVMQAQRMSPAVRNLPEVLINQGSLMRDVFFDNIFTDMAFHEEIKASRANVERAAMFLAQQLQSAQQRAQSIGSELSRKEQDMRNKRIELQKERERAFENVAGSASGLPPYEP
ncbi:hypothetical protein QBC35DRAFT_504850 [Podospora australis]|uniref:Uncharacterized protein n=1 Tax=Podospora australis TaxID=1536484 RepID=A0AAN7AGE3_9PEZI|nr:hypothetical protein QBC35DRAFT_504850 [Podospora australis]